MTPHRLTAVICDREPARRLASTLQDLVEPAPSALTLFEAESRRWLVEAYYDTSRDADTARQGAIERLGADAAVLQSELVPQKNWVALSQAALPPVRAGRFTVLGTHDRGRVPLGPNALIIDAGEAFGTAHHATTFGCLEALDRLARRSPITRALDLGCGSGVLALALARSLPHARLFAVDIDRTSVAVARANITANGAARRIAIFEADGFRSARLSRQRPFDCIVANILAEPLKALAPDMRRFLVPGGLAILSGLLIGEAPEVIATYRAHGFVLRAHARLTGWSTLTLIRR